MNHPAAVLAVAATAAALALPVPAPSQTPGANGDSAQSRDCDPLEPPRVARLNGPGWQYLRAAELAGKAPLGPSTLRRLSDYRTAFVCAGAGSTWRAEAPSEGVTLLPVSVHNEFNSAYPDDVNNGALWGGRGWNTSARAGVRLDWGPLSAAVEPELTFHQNRDFDQLDLGLGGARRDSLGPSRFQYPWHVGIDWPVRFGEDGYSRINPGQSYARIDWKGVAVGVSHENLWRGPATRYPIVLGNAASGFPHLFVGTSRPADVGVGELHARALWGRLEESDYFDLDPDNDDRLFSNATVTFRPAFARGLLVGLTYSYENIRPPEGLPFSEYLQVLSLSEGGAETAGNGLGSLFLRWAFPEVGFEAYAEWAREDFAANLRDFLHEPDHSQGYTLGFQKVWAGDRPRVKLTGELVNLRTSFTGFGNRGARPPVTYYVHTPVRQGYTHRGQLLGAYVGPGSNAQFVGLDVFTDWGTVGGFVERIRWDDDTYFNTNFAPQNAHRESLAERFKFRGHDVELKAGVEGRISFRALSVRDEYSRYWPLDLSLAVTMAGRSNRNFLLWEEREVLFEDTSVVPHEVNWSVDLGATWWPDR